MTTGRGPAANQRKGLRRNVPSLQALIDADSDVLLDWLATALAMTTRHQAPLSIKERLSTDQGRVAAAGDHAANAVGRDRQVGTGHETCFHDLPVKARQMVILATPNLFANSA